MIRPATAGDAEPMAAIFSAAARIAWGFLGPEAVAALDTAPAFSPDATWVAEVDGRVVGFASIRPGELHTLYTHPQAWGTGAGRALLAHAEAQLRAQGFAEATLWTEERNERALRVYAAAGWRPDGPVRERIWHGTPLRELRLRRRL